MYTKLKETMEMPFAEPDMGLIDPIQECLLTCITSLCGQVF